MSHHEVLDKVSFSSLRSSFLHSFPLVRIDELKKGAETGKDASKRLPAKDFSPSLFFLLRAIVFDISWPYSEPANMNDHVYIAPEPFIEVSLSKAHHDIEVKLKKMILGK